MIFRGLPSSQNRRNYIASRRLLHGLREGKLALAHAHADLIARNELPFQDARRERILDLLLDRALQRPSTVYRIEARLPDEVARLVIELQVHVALHQPLAQVRELNVDDLADLLGSKRVEHHDVVDAIDELRPETLLHDLHDGLAHARVV